MSNKKCFSPFSFFFFESYDKLRTKKNNMSVGESAKSSANSLLNMIKNDVGNKGLIAGIIKYAFLLLILVKIPVFILGFDEWDAYINTMVLNIIFPLFQLAFFVFTAFKFMKFFNIQNNADSYSKFKTLIFWISILSIVQLAYNFSIYIGYRRQQRKIKTHQEKINEIIQDSKNKKLEQCQKDYEDILKENKEIMKANEKQYAYNLY